MVRKGPKHELPHLAPPRRRKRRSPTGVLASLRSSFFTGAMVLVPIGVTFWLIWWLTGWIDGWVMPFIPLRWRPDNWLGVNPRGLGVVIIVTFTMLIGWLARGYIGRAMIRNAEAIVDRMPIVRSIYGGLKQISETILTPGDEKFERACLVEYPRRGAYRIGLVSGPARAELTDIDGIDDRILSVFLPNTPNATTGFLIYVAERELIFLDMSVEDAAKLVISAGLVYPTSSEKSDDRS
ncbi:DUF502 domain-containing protein [Paracoccus aminophilus]|uniref:DUF502 domain-containing protein n=1 Tax=Paracoccus aminophilus JCM 7686 TaxID=1367847 RepID=S5XTF4_PARAH|nr:DUF502 domain-containing protein [Paracoccus aminophilus]AGT08452.1 hypothetical protein JCM7686_1351 [Paracoccus aminophilus JCM 7686]